MAKAKKYRVISIHDGGDREVIRHECTTEAEAMQKAKVLYDRGYLVDVVKMSGNREMLLKTFSYY
jgi:hypothetical protein